MNGNNIKIPEYRHITQIIVTLRLKYGHLLTASPNRIIISSNTIYPWFFFTTGGHRCLHKPSRIGQASRLHLWPPLVNRKVVCLLSCVGQLTFYKKVSKKILVKCQRLQSQLEGGQPHGISQSLTVPPNQWLIIVQHQILSIFWSVFSGLQHGTFTLEKSWLRHSWCDFFFFLLQSSFL